MKKISQQRGYDIFRFTKRGLDAICFGKSQRSVPTFLPLILTIYGAFLVAVSFFPGMEINIILSLLDLSLFLRRCWQRPLCTDSIYYLAKYVRSRYITSSQHHKVFLCLERVCYT